MNLRQLFLDRLAPTSFAPIMLEIDHASGIYLYDKNGKAYIDLIAGISVSSLGHRHPEIQKAIHHQLDKYWHTLVYGEFVLSPQVNFADLLCQHLPASLNSVYFVNSGSEATEGAMKLAKRVTGRGEIIAAKRAYHGSTQGAASLMNPREFTQPFHPLIPGIKHIDYNCLTCLEQITDQTAAVIIETVQAEWGVRAPHPIFLSTLREKCNETGTLLIFDEVQTGFGRTGSLFAFEQYHVIPDIILLGKALGGGMPIGAFISSKTNMDQLANNPPLGHITTFGGHPVSCAAGLAALKVLTNSDIIQSVSQKAELFKKSLVHPKIKDIRHAGLLMAVELNDFEEVKKVINSCLEKGLITDWFLFNDRCLRIAPPLVITEPEIKKACNILLECLDELMD